MSVTGEQIDEIVEVYTTSGTETPRSRFIGHVVSIVDPYMKVPEEKKFKDFAKVIKLLDKKHEQHGIDAVQNHDTASDPFRGVCDDNRLCCISIIEGPEGRSFGT